MPPISTVVQVALVYCNRVTLTTINSYNKTMLGINTHFGKICRDDRKGMRTLSAICFFILALSLWTEVIGPYLSMYFVNTDVNTLIYRHRWITYEPIGFDPYLSQQPNIEAVNQELEWIRLAGFDGIITFTSQGNMAVVPELAKKKRLFVIMGVWDPRDAREVALAISKRQYVDAYSVGHNNLNNLYSYSELARAIRHIRFITKRPVSTTEKIERYLSPVLDRELLKISDWLFPDAHVSIKRGQTGTFDFDVEPRRDGQEILDRAQLLTRLPERHGKPIMLKMVTYPTSGIAKASQEEQAAFFTTIFNNSRDAMPDLPGDVAVSVHSAFDIRWKLATRWPFYEPWEASTGLLDDRGRPHSAVREIQWRLP
jgi:exo-beta-1,3-glucanase (GH17 family)